MYPFMAQALREAAHLGHHPVCIGWLVPKEWHAHNGLPMIDSLHHQMSTAQHQISEKLNGTLHECAVKRVISVMQEGDVNTGCSCSSVIYKKVVAMCVHLIHTVNPHM